ncbi:MAG: hypothetical protein R2850_09605 [Bacteroidia bacterium]
MSSSAILISDVAGDTLRGDAYTFFDRQVFIKNVDTSRKFACFTG